MHIRIGCLAAWLTLSLTAVAAAQDASPELTAALERAGENAAELRAAMEKLPEDQQSGIRFLIENMPERDLRSLKADYLVENVSFGYRAWRESPWHDQIDEATFLNYILPYASINEKRDDWRRDFYDRFHELVKDAKTPGEAAAILNNNVFKQLNVRYSTKRARADQGPAQSIESGLASCTGLSVVLIDACRAVGVPARFVGTPLWSDGSGNHSWVEVWDDGWHFTGAAEPSGMNLDAAWFSGRAASAKRDSRLNAIYATSFKKTPIKFPCVWDRRVDYVFAVNVTDRYTSKQEALPEGQGYARFRVLNAEGDRVECDVQVTSESNETVFAGQTRDERFDTNDHLFAMLPLNKPFELTATHDGQQVSKQFELSSREQLFTLVLAKGEGKKEDAEESTLNESKTDPITDLKRYLSTPRDDREAFENLPFASETLDKAQALEAQELLWNDHAESIRQSRKEEMEAKVLTDGELKMPFDYKIFGDKPEGGRSLYISMHGGGGAPSRVNDQQWQNQKRLYEPAEGIYLAPRAPTDTWNLWHQGHIDKLFARLIENLVVTEDVNPDRVYVMGYSAGGDGVYQLAPRMADRWAAAAMMAGHPNDASPLGLRNIGFAIYMGGKDGAFSRNRVAGEWKEKLDKLAADDSGGYNHLVTIYEDKGHWMDREDASSLEWMSQQTRNPLPEKIVWKQDDVTHPRFYWLATPEPQGGALVEATREGQTIDITANRAMRISIRLNDQMINLDEPIKVMSGDKVLHDGLVSRSIETIAKSIAERGDPKSVFSGEVTVEVGG